MTMEQQINIAKKFFKNRKNYFRHAKEEVAKRNFSRVFQCSTITIGLAFLLFVITPMLYPEWHVSSPYITLLMIMLFFAVGSAICMGRGKGHSQFSMAWTIIFYMILEGMIIYIDVVENKTSEVMFFPFLVVLFSVLFIVPVWMCCLINCAMVLICMGVTYYIRTPEIFINDTYTNLLALIFSIIVANLVMNLRCEENQDKYHYKKLSSIDGLTGTLNKSTSANIVSEYMEHKPDRECFALLMIDVDQFKSVNDNLGHQLGDEVLQRMGEILEKCFRNEDVVGRVGGDEFMVLMRDVSQKKLVEERCREVNERARQIDSYNKHFSISCSIGAVYSHQNMSYEKCYDLADQALYEAKARGRDSYVLREV